jgi:hypothetical protein
MAEFQFLDKIINTVSLQVKPNNKYKTKTHKYLSSFISTLVPNYITKNNFYNLSYSQDYNFSKNLLYTDSSYTPLTIFLPENNYYFSSSNTLYVSDGFETQIEYDSIITLNIQPEKTEDYDVLETYYNSTQFIISQTITSLSPSIVTSTFKSSSSTESTILYTPESYQNFQNAYSIHRSFILDNPLYIQNTEDTLNLGLDLETNYIVQIEDVVASTYTPPNPSDITIITLKEFWA